MVDESPTTNAAIRRRYTNGESLNDGSPLNTVADAPDGSADTVVGADTDIHVVTPDATNTVDLSAAAVEGRVVTVVHGADGANTPNVEFTDADFVGTGPADLGDAGDTATVANVDGSETGFVVVATGSA